MEDKQIEERFYNLGQRIAKFDDRVLELHNEYESMHEFQGKQLESYKDLDKSIEYINSHIDGIILRIEGLKSQLDGSNKDIKDSKEFIDRNSNKLEKLDLKHGEHANTLQDMQMLLDSFAKDMSAKSNALNDLNLELSNYKEKVVNCERILKSVVENQKHFQDDINNFKSNIMDVSASHANSIEQQNKKIEEHANKIDLSKNDIQKEKQDMLNSFTHARKYFDTLEGSHEDLLNDFMKKFDEKLESIKLDISNSVIRSTNVERHNQILDKKIEKINLLLKQHELNK